MRFLQAKSIHSWQSINVKVKNKVKAKAGAFSKPAGISAPVVTCKIKRCRNWQEVLDVYLQYKELYNHIHLSATFLHVAKLITSYQEQRVSGHSQSHQKSNVVASSVLSKESDKKRCLKFIRKLLLHVGEVCYTLDLQGASNVIYAMAILQRHGLLDAAFLPAKVDSHSSTNNPASFVASKNEAENQNAAEGLITTSRTKRSYTLFQAQNDESGSLLSSTYSSSDNGIVNCPPNHTLPTSSTLYSNGVRTSSSPSNYQGSSNSELLPPLGLDTQQAEELSSSISRLNSSNNSSISEVYVSGQRSWQSASPSNSLSPLRNFPSISPASRQVLTVSPALLEQLLDHIQYRMDTAVPQNLGNIIWSLAVLKCPPSSDWLLLYYSAVDKVIHQFNSQDVANTLMGFGLMQYKVSQSLISKLLRQAYAILPTFRPMEVSSMLWGLAHLRFRPSGPWLEGALSMVVPALARMGPQELAVTGWALGKLKVFPRAEWCQEYVLCCEARLDAMNRQELCLVIWALGTLKVALPPTTLPLLQQALLPMTKGLPPAVVVFLLLGHARLGLRPPQHLMAALWGLTVKDMQGLSVELLATIMHSLAVIQVKPRPGWLERYLEAWEVRFLTVTPRAKLVSTLVWSLARLRVQVPAGFLAAIQDSLVLGNEFRRFSAVQLGLLCWGLARLGAPPPSDAWTARVWWASLAQIANRRLTATSLPVLLMGILKLGLAPHSTWVRAYQEEFMRLMPELSMRDLAQVSKALCNLDPLPTTNWTLHYYSFTWAAAPKLAPRDWVDVAFAAAVLNNVHLVHPVWLSRLFTLTLPLLSACNPGQLVSLGRSTLRILSNPRIHGAIKNPNKKLEAGNQNTASLQPPSAVDDQSAAVRGVGIYEASGSTAASQVPQGPSARDLQSAAENNGNGVAQTSNVAAISQSAEVFVAPVAQSAAQHNGNRLAQSQFSATATQSSEDSLPNAQNPLELSDNAASSEPATPIQFLDSAGSRDLQEGGAECKGNQVTETSKSASASPIPEDSASRALPDAADDNSSGLAQPSCSTPACQGLQESVSISPPKLPRYSGTRSSRQISVPKAWGREYLRTTGAALTEMSNPHLIVLVQVVLRLGLEPDRSWMAAYLAAARVRRLGDALSDNMDRSILALCRYVSNMDQKAAHKNLGRESIPEAEEPNSIGKGQSDREEAATNMDLAPVLQVASGTSN